MFTFTIQRLSFYARCRVTKRDVFIAKSTTRLKSTNGTTTKTFSTTVSSQQSKQSLFRTVISKWSLTFGIGVVISIYAFTKAKFSAKKKEEGPVNDLAIECYCFLPLRITSRIWGWIASVELPVSLRPKVYGLYAKTFKANLDEISKELSAFPSLVDFFVRPLKDDARPISGQTNIVSPVDGTVVHFGPVTSCNVEQVKGVTYNLRHFLGDIDWPLAPVMDKKVCTDYISSLLKNPDNCLYQLTVYLAPGDYHRFHSPTDWTIDYRRHFQGKLLSVNPRIAGWLPNLFTLNERVVYIGEWSGGFMAYAAIGATNVGSIRVFCDENLVTNERKWPRGKVSDDADMGQVKVKKGELFGEFRMGSTVVLLFEAPKNFDHFCVQRGCIKVGQPLAQNFVRCK